MFIFIEVVGLLKFNYTGHCIVYLFDVHVMLEIVINSFNTKYSNGSVDARYLE